MITAAGRHTCRYKQLVLLLALSHTHSLTHTHTRTHAHARMHARTHARTHAHTHTHTHTTHICSLPPPLPSHFIISFPSSPGLPLPPKAPPHLRLCAHRMIRLSINMEENS